MRLKVFVTLKPGVLDPQGRAIHHALNGLGFDGVEDVRAGSACCPKAATMPCSTSKATGSGGASR